MKKLVIISIVAAMLLASGAVFGNGASHDVEIRIPNVLMLRITDGSSNAAATNPAVVFDFEAADNMDTYMDMVNGGGGDLEPTSVNNFGDVKVFSNRAEWNVTVAATGIVFDPDVVAGLPGNGVALSDITVVPDGTPGQSVSLVTDWNLATMTPIAKGERTKGWSSLGFSGTDYRLAVSGDEDPGSYTTTVTYTIAAP